MKCLQRIAVYGGTFDPAHAGHMAVAQGLGELFALDEVLFIPAHVAPHKRGSAVTRALHRYAMLVLATQDAPRFRISTIEIDAPEKPYTVETLAHLQAETGATARLFFVMGADSWQEITTWREWERLLAMSDHIVVTRPGYELSATHVPASVGERVIDLRGASAEDVARKLERNEGARIYVTDAIMEDVSATGIRRALRRAETRDEALRRVPPPVADYIEKYRLYREEDGTEFNQAGSESAH